MLFAASLFAAVTVFGRVVQGIIDGTIDVPNSEIYAFARRLSGVILKIFAIKMAGVFILSTCTMPLRTAIFPQWMAFSGLACALVLLLAPISCPWIVLVFPFWMMLLSSQVGSAELGHTHENAAVPK